MTTNKWFTAIFSIAILAAFVFTVQGFAANSELVETAARSEAILNASSARWTGLAGRAVAETSRTLRVNGAAADRLSSMSDYYPSRQVRIISAQSGRLTAMADFYTAKALKVNTAQSDRLTAMAAFYNAKGIKTNTAQAARLSAMAKYYTQLMTEHQQRVREAEAARWSGLAAKFFAEQ